MLLLTTCKNLYSYAARLALGAATSPTMAERTNLCPDQGKRDQPMSENMTCQAQVLFLCREVTFRSDLPEAPAFSRAPAITRYMRGSSHMPSRRDKVRSCHERAKAFSFGGWLELELMCKPKKESIAAQTERKAMFSHDGSFPEMLSLSLSSCMTP